MADDMASCLKDAYGKIDNLYEAIEWLELGAFRGYAHLEKIYANPGTADLTVEHLEPVEQWHWTRKSMYAEWEYVAAATQTNIGVPINYEQFVIHEVRRPLDRVALVLWMRANLCEKNWDAFIEIYGVPHWLVFMPPNVPKEQRGNILAVAAIPSPPAAMARCPTAAAPWPPTSRAIRIHFARDWIGSKSNSSWPAPAACFPCSQCRRASATARVRYTKMPSKKSEKKRRAKSRRYSTPNSMRRYSPKNFRASRPWPASN